MNTEALVVSEVAFLVYSLGAVGEAETRLQWVKMRFDARDRVLRAGALG